MKKWLFLLFLLLPITSMAADLEVDFDFQGGESALIESPAVEGQQESIIYDFDSSYIENVVLPIIEISYPKQEETEIGKKEEKTDYKLMLRKSLMLGGIGIFYSSNFSSIDIPFSYRFNDKLLLKTRIPYIKRKITINGKDYKANGLGDILLGIDYTWIDNPNFSTTTSFMTSLPTGKNDETDNGILIPLGKDSYNIQLSQSFIKNLDYFTLRGNVGFKYYITDNEFTYNGIDYEEDVGSKFYFTLGGDKYIGNSGLKVSGKVTYIQKEESDLKKSGSSSSGLANDMKLMDLIINCSYYGFKFFNIDASVIIPVYDDYNEDIHNPKDRDVAVYLMATKLF